MPVSHKHKVIFIHIPKTAGTSVEFVFGMHDELQDIGIRPYLNQKKNLNMLFGKELQHLKAKKIKKIIGPETFNEYYKFSIVRNPYDRLVSYFAWLHGKWANKEELDKKTFSELFYRFNKGSILKKTRLPEPQYKFIYIDNHLVTDRVIKFEEIDQSAEILLQHFGINEKLPVRMKSFHKNYPFYFDKNMTGIVRKYYKKDFELFEYSTDF